LNPSKAAEVSSEDAQWLAEVEAESIGWLPLGDGAYLHMGKPDHHYRGQGHLIRLFT